MRGLSLLALCAVPAVVASPSWGGFGIQTHEGALDTPARTQSGWNFIDCGLPTDVIQIESLTISPDPPKPGEDLTVKVSAYVTKTIEDGAYADVTVKLGLIKLLQKRFDVCDEAQKNNAEIQCPVEAGQHHVEQTVALPKEIPPAQFVVMVRGYTVDDEDMLCADIKVDFRKKPF